MSFFVVFPVLLTEMEQNQEQSQTSSSKTQAQLRIEKSQVVYTDQFEINKPTRHNTNLLPLSCSMFSNIRICLEMIFEIVFPRLACDIIT